MRTRKSLAGLSILGLALILIYWNASAKVDYQSTHMKQDRANPTTNESPNTNGIPTSTRVSEHIRRTHMKVDHTDLTSNSQSTDATVSVLNEIKVPMQLPSQFPTSQSISRSSEHGYVVGMFYWEQLTMATNSFLDLQCWAARHKLVVVQPSLEVIASYLKFTFDESLQKPMLQLSDIYNMTEWNSYSKHQNLAPLVSRDEFLKELPHFEKEVILVEIHYEDRSGGHECNFSWKIELQALKRLKHLQVSRKVCLKNNIVDVNKFDQLIFGELQPVNTVVFIREWRGISPPPRANINQKCEPGRQTFLLSKPLSERIMNDADAYVKKYLGNFGEYNAVVGRFEKAMDNYWNLGVATKKARIKALVQETTERLSRLNEKTNIANTFLAYDYGKYGSRTFFLQHYYQSDDVLRQFQQDVYSGSMSYNDWEHSFLDICHINHTGYISLLQLVIASRAKCLLRVGWSNFLDYVTRTYLRNHPTVACMECVPSSSKCGNYTIL